MHILYWTNKDEDVKAPEPSDLSDDRTLVYEAGDVVQADYEREGFVTLYPEGPGFYVVLTDTEIDLIVAAREKELAIAGS